MGNLQRYQAAIHQQDLVAYRALGVLRSLISNGHITEHVRDLAEHIEAEYLEAHRVVEMERGRL